MVELGYPDVFLSSGGIVTASRPPEIAVNVSATPFMLGTLQVWYGAAELADGLTFALERGAFRVLRAGEVAYSTDLTDWTSRQEGDRLVEPWIDFTVDGRNYRIALDSASWAADPDQSADDREVTNLTGIVFGAQPPPPAPQPAAAEPGIASPAILRGSGSRHSQPPGLEVGQRPRRDRALLGHRLLGRFPSPGLPLGLLDRNRRKQPEVDVHRLKAPRAGISFGLDVPAGDMVEQRPERCRIRRRVKPRSGPFGRRHAPGEQTDRRALDIALDPGNLAGEAQPRVGAKFQLPRQHLR